MKFNIFSVKTMLLTIYNNSLRNKIKNINFENDFYHNFV